MPDPSNANAPTLCAARRGRGICDLVEGHLGPHDDGRGKWHDRPGLCMKEHPSGWLCVRPENHDGECE